MAGLVIGRGQWTRLRGYARRQRAVQNESFCCRAWLFGRQYEHCGAESGELVVPSPLGYLLLRYLNSVRWRIPHVILPCPYPRSGHRISTIWAQLSVAVGWA